jgi:dipeptidyl aminopeptidase/acylaminoacyl peptidase
MKVRGFICVAALAFSAAAAAQVATPTKGITDPRSIVSPANPKARPAPVADLFYIRNGGGAVWSPDGKTIALTTNLTGRTNIWTVDAAGGWPVQLTQSDERQTDPDISPDGKTLMFNSDHGGDEMWDIFAVPLAGGEAVNLTSTADVSETDVVFSPDGSKIAFSTRAKDKPYASLAVMTLADHRIKLLTPAGDPDWGWTAAGWAGPDAIIANRSNAGQNKGDIWRVPLNGGAPQAIVAPKGESYAAASDVSPNGKLVAFNSNEKNGTPQAAVYDLDRKTTHWLNASVWEQQSGRFSRDNGLLSFITRVDSLVEGSLYDVAAGKAAPVKLPPGVNGAGVFGPERKLLVTHQSAATPLDYWIVDPKTASPRQLTRLALASIDPSALPQSKIVHYPGKDGTPISAVLLIPPNLKRDGSAPGIVIPHGGPTGQTVDSFDRDALALASRGYMVIKPNFRGSTGYGLAFQKANFKDLGGGDLDDVVAGAKFLADTGYVDAKRIGITGGSYGGFMTLMAIGRRPDVFAAAVSQYGIINWYEMYRTESPALQAYQRSLIGDPVADKAVYDAASPMTYIKQARAPLLVLQGENDVRVPKGQAAEVVATLKSIGREVDVHYYPAEGHGFAKRENQIDALQRTVDWFDKRIGAGRKQ